MFGYRRGYRYKRWRYPGYRPYKRMVVSFGLVLLALAGMFAIRQAVHVATMSGRPMQVAVVEPIDNLQPAVLANHSQVLAASAVYEGLVFYDEKSGEVKPLLAEKWEYSEEGKVLTIILKKGYNLQQWPKSQRGSSKIGLGEESELHPRLGQPVPLSAHRRGRRVYEREVEGDMGTRGAR